jgi:hypothetical protein
LKQTLDGETYFLWFWWPSSLDKERCELDVSLYIATILSHQTHAVSSLKASLLLVADPRIASLGEFSLSLWAYNNERCIFCRLASHHQTDNGSVFALSSPVSLHSPHRGSQLLSYAFVRNGIESSSPLCVSLLLFADLPLLIHLHSLPCQLRFSVPRKQAYHFLGIGLGPDT